ncbi:MAG: hypothetical protein JWO51_259 [Rhodospirillales bacterium]|nr:hypothetical protein [Rhodospirillales bacterium]
MTGHSMIEAGEFRDRLQAPALLKLFDYWQSVRGARPMPTWSDIKPENMAIVLPHIWVWRVSDADEVQLRLVGESIYQALSRDLRGKTPEDLYPASISAEIRTRLLKVARLPAGNLTVGDVFHDREKIGTGERLALPYADSRGRGVIGASVLAPLRDPATGQPRLINPKAFFTLVGAEAWLPLVPDAA